MLAGGPRSRRPFPWGTLFVNVSGSFIVGFFATVAGPAGRFPVSPTTRDFFIAGFCGGYTTFSAFSLQTLALWQEEKWTPAAWNIGLSVALCVSVR